MESSWGLARIRTSMDVVRWVSIIVYRCHEVRAMKAILLAAFCVLFCLSAGEAKAGEEKIALDKLPKAVSEAVSKKFPKADLKDAVKETTDGKVTYEVTIKDGKTKIDVNLTDAGVITGYKKEVKLKDMPKAVSDAVAAKHPTGKAKTAEIVYTVKDSKDTLAFYEVFVEVDGKTIEVEVLEDGKLKPADKK